MLKNMKLSTRLLISFSSLMLFMIIIVFIALLNMNSIENRLEKIVSDNIHKYKLAKDMSESVHIVSEAMRNLVIFEDQAAMKRELDKIEQVQAVYDEAEAELVELTNNDEGRAICARIVQSKNAAREHREKVMNLALANRSQEAVNLLINKAAPAAQIWQDALNENMVFQENKNKMDAEAAKVAYNSAFISVSALSIITILVGAGLAFIVTRSITKPINQVAQNLSEGSDQVASASEQLSSTSQQLAEGSSEQAASIEETSSTLEEASSMIKQNSENTKQAAVLAGQAKAAADKGNKEMQDMMESMAEIKKSSDQIAKIIKVIDDIAFQTNILALNAAVEAARAGDAGMGFAVVAEEVRNLAQRSAQAAKDTAAIIESNIEMSEKGVSISKMVAESLAEITLQSKKVNELMEEIAAASQEQTQGIMQINKAIVQMEQVTQQNAANAEESASASEELSAQAVSMKDVVGQLVKLVKGNTNVSISDKQFNTKTGSIRDAGQGNRAIGKLPPGNAGSRNAAKNAAAKHGAKTREINPEEVIPLEEDSENF